MTRQPSLLPLAETMARAPAGPLFVLGVDPGMASLGWGIVRRSGGILVHIAHGVAITEAKDGDEDDRVQLIVQRAVEAIHAARPIGCDVAVYEDWVLYGASEKDPRRGKQAKNILRVIGGLLLSVPRIRNGGTAQGWRAGVGVSRKAEKEEVADRVVELLAMSERPRPLHASDALALACSVAMRGGA